jgi:hypothetical protein
MVAGKNMDYWYDAQIKRYLIQLIRVFSNFQVKENTRDGVNYNRVPVKYGDASRMVAHILRNNSENVINSAPQISLYITNMLLSRDRAQDPFLQDTQQVAEREWDEVDGSYTSEQGNLYTVKRYMPVPYDMTINVDIWTTNTDTKLQILEQFFVLFNPSIQLQSNDNPLDWTNVFEVNMRDITWSNRSVPSGTDEQLDIATISFEVPIWISPPAKVARQTIIQQIINDINTIKSVEDLGFDSSYYDFFSTIESDGNSILIVTPGNLKLQVSNGTATLIDTSLQPFAWQDLLEQQGELRESSKLQLNLSEDAEAEDQLVTGSVTALPGVPQTLVFNLDPETLPSNSLNAVDKMIDPRESKPGGVLPAAALGQRYLIVESMLSTTFPEWNLTADVNDIIEYNGTEWVVAFDASEVDSVQWVLNTFANEQYKWTGSEWISSWQGTYNPGYWRLLL